MSDGKIRQGQRVNRQAGVVERFTEQMMDDASVLDVLGDARTEVIPHDFDSSLVRVSANMSTILDAVVKQVAGTINMGRGQLPDQIVGFTVTFNKNEQAGEDIQDEPLTYSGGSHGQLTPSARASAQAGAAVMPDLQVGIKETPGENLPCTHIFFYMSGTITQAAVLTRLGTITGGTVAAWPLFRPKSLYFTLKGQQVSVSAKAQAEHSAFWDTVSYSWSTMPQSGKRADGFSKETGVTNRSLVVQPTIHPAFTLTGGTDSAIASVEVSAKLTAITGTVTLPAVTNHPAARTATANAAITPTAIPATTSYPSGYTSIPTSGTFLVELQSQFSEFDDYSFVHAVIINAAIFS